MKPEALSSILADGPVTDSWERPAALAWRSIGRLMLPTGRIIASDGAEAPNSVPLVGSVAPGEYEVRLGIAALENNDERVAFALLCRVGRSPAEVRSWKLAELEVDKEDWDEPGYGVDSGTGCFCDVAAAEGQEAMGDDWFKWWDDVVLKEMEKVYRHTRDWAIIGIDDAAPAYAVFSSGFGDGVYSSYWGLAEDGEPIALLTDFDIIGGEEG